MTEVHPARKPISRYQHPHRTTKRRGSYRVPSASLTCMLVVGSELSTSNLVRTASGSAFENVPGIDVDPDPDPDGSADVVGAPNRLPDPENGVAGLGGGGRYSSFVLCATRSSTGWPTRTFRTEGGAEPELMALRIAWFAGSSYLRSGPSAMLKPSRQNVISRMATSSCCALV
jgi:hypothetical protein